MNNRKHYIILESYTGFRDGFYPEDTASTYLEKAKEMFPKGNFILTETDEYELNDRRYGDIPSDEFEAMIEQAKSKERKS